MQFIDKLPGFLLQFDPNSGSLDKVVGRLLDSQIAGFVEGGTIAQNFLFFLLPSATELRQGNVFRSVCQEFCPQMGFLPQCMLGYTPLGRHPTSVDTPSLADIPQADAPPVGYCSGRYASYWNAFLFFFWRTSVLFLQQTFFRLKLKCLSRRNSCQLIKSNYGKTSHNIYSHSQNTNNKTNKQTKTTN